jgi:hypothetical protein
MHSHIPPYGKHNDIYCTVYNWWHKVQSKPTVSHMPGASPRTMVKKQRVGAALSKRGVMTSQFRKGQPCLVWQKLLWFTVPVYGDKDHAWTTRRSNLGLQLHSYMHVMLRGFLRWPCKAQTFHFDRVSKVLRENILGFVASEQWRPTSTSSSDPLCTSVFQRWFRHVLHRWEQAFETTDIHFGSCKVFKGFMCVYISHNEEWSKIPTRVWFSIRSIIIHVEKYSCMFIYKEKRWMDGWMDVYI